MNFDEIHVEYFLLPLFSTNLMWRKKMYIRISSGNIFKNKINIELMNKYADFDVSKPSVSLV